jgi:hypothetical protein
MQWTEGEELIDYADASWELADKAWPGDRLLAEPLAIDAFTNGIPTALRERVEQKTFDSLLEVAEYSEKLYVKMKSRGHKFKVNPVPVISETTSFSHYDGDDRW